MYAHISGMVADKSVDSIVIEAGGVGYLMMVSAATLSVAPAVGERMKLYCVLNVREDAMELFGFYSKEEKAMFERLRGVSGIGARTALQLLSSMSVKELSIAIVSGDARSITKAPGVGMKTAQRVVLELKDKIKDSELTDNTAANIAPVKGGLEAEAIQALMALGYASSESAAAVSGVHNKAKTVDELIFMALKSMGN